MRLNKEQRRGEKQMELNKSPITSPPSPIPPLFYINGITEVLSQQQSTPAAWQEVIEITTTPPLKHLIPVTHILISTKLKEQEEGQPNTMSRRNTGKGPRLELELKLNLSPPRANPMEIDINSPHRSSTSSTPTSPPSSCLSSETEHGGLRYSSSPEAKSMVLVGCPRCLMYVMLSEDDPKCPRCKSTVLLDFFNHPSNINSNLNKKNRKR